MINSNKLTEQALAQAALQSVKAAEAQLDANLQALDNLTEDDFMKLRKQRLKNLQKLKEMEMEWKSKGHGVYTEISEQKEFFDACKRSKHVVCHFYRPSTFRCKIVDKHLNLIAAKHLECRFIKLNAEKAPFLATRLDIIVLPTLILTEEQETLGKIIGFDELGGKDDFKTIELARLLAKKGVLNPDKIETWENQDKEKPKSSNVTSANPLGKSIYSKMYDDFEDDSDPDFWKSDNEDDDTK